MIDHSDDGIRLKNPLGITFTACPVSLTRTRVSSGRKTMVLALGLDDLRARWARWLGGSHVQVAFSNLSPEARGFLLDGWTPQEWREIFLHDDWGGGSVP